MKKLNEEDKEEAGYYNHKQKQKQIFKMRRPIGQKDNHSCQIAKEYCM